MAGASLSGAIVHRLAEDPGLPFDGYISIDNRGVTDVIDFGLAIQIGLDAVGLWDPALGQPGNVRNDMDFFADALPWAVAVDSLARQGDPRLEFLRLVLGAGPGWAAQGELSDGGPQSVGGVAIARARLSLFVIDLLLASFVAADWENQVGEGGQQNLDHNYQLCADDRAYLLGLGLSDEVIDTFLARMNATRIGPPDAATRADFARFDLTTGAITRPVLSIRSRNDHVTLPYLDKLYRRRVAPDNQENLVQQYVVQPTHTTNYTPAQMLEAVQAMDRWVESGVAPGSAAFPSADGWEPNFVSRESPFHPNYCPEPGAGISLAAGASALAALSRRRRS